MLLYWGAPLTAQLNRGAVEGIVTDTHGGVVPGVTVVVTDVDTNVTQTAKTNGAGYYQAVDLVPGDYRVHFEAAGFTAVDVTDIKVLAGAPTRVDRQLTVGVTRQRIEVRAGAQVLETAASNFSTTLQSDLIRDLPLAGHDLQQLVFLMPGVNVLAGPPGSNFGFNSEFGTFPDPTHIFGSDVSVNGGQGGTSVVQNGMWDPSSTVGPDVNGLFQRTAFGTPVPRNPFGANGCLNTSVEAGAAMATPVVTCNFATQLPANRLDPTAMFFIQSFPMPNHIDTTGSCPLATGGGVSICNNFLGPVGTSQDVNNFSIKIDHAWSGKSKYFGEWLFSPGKYNNFRVPWTGPTRRRPRQGAADRRLDQPGCV
ncbi:MAG TPA: carboxypeptidase-like regulatory domain-containing protein [Terriglobia bacterium]|nr:carboxypeptidase-like regulatory domain-containing protein [Terriglobia bacterium]